jgi:hypothetical protein
VRTLYLIMGRLGGQPLPKWNRDTYDQGRT